MKKDKLLEKFKRMKQRKRPKRLKMRKIKPFLRRIASDIKNSWRTQIKENQDAETMEICLILESELLEGFKNET